MNAKSVALALSALLLPSISIAQVQKKPIAKPGERISPDLKHTLAAATDPDAKMADVYIYLRNSRLQVRTKRDADLQRKLQKAINLFEDVDKITDEVVEVRATLRKEDKLDSDSRALTEARERDAETTEANLKAVAASNPATFDSAYMAKMEKEFAELREQIKEERKTREDSEAARKSNRLVVLQGIESEQQTATEEERQASQFMKEIRAAVQ